MTLEDAKELMRAGRPDECLELLLALSDEPWCSDARREWLHSRKNYLRPCFYSSKGAYYWIDETGHEVDYRETPWHVPAWAIDAVGRVDCWDNQTASGEYTPNRPLQECWCDLMEGLARR